MDNIKFVDFIEELLGVELKPYQKLVIENFRYDKQESKKNYEILNSFSEFQDDGYLGNMETYYNVRSNKTGKVFTVHEDEVGKYRY